MPVTTPDNLWSPGSDDPYSLQTITAAMQSSVQNALIVRGNSYAGTAAQRASVTGSVGATWQDTDGLRVSWVWVASNVWHPQPGKIVPVINQITRDTLKDEVAALGVDFAAFPLYVDRRDTNQLQRWDGTSWRSITFA